MSEQTLARRTNETDDYPLRAKTVFTHYDNPVTHSYGGHTVTREDMHKRLLEQGYHITMVNGFLTRHSIIIPADQDLEPYTALVATRRPQEKTQFTRDEHVEYQKLISSCHLPYVYFDEPDGPWMKYESSVYDSSNSWMRGIVPVTMKSLEEGAPVEGFQE